MFTFILSKEQNVKKCLPKWKHNGQDYNYNILKVFSPHKMTANYKEKNRNVTIEKPGRCFLDQS